MAGQVKPFQGFTSIPQSFGTLWQFKTSSAFIWRFAYGVGAISPHIMDENTERPVAFVSRMLSKAETNYAHLEKEALSIIFGINKFHNYLYGRQFIISSH